MKPKSKNSFAASNTKRFERVRLFRDDIDRIVALAKTRELIIEITDNEYEYESIEELQNNRGDSISHVKFVFQSPAASFDTLWLDIDPQRISVMSGTSDSLVAFYYEICQIIEQRAPWYRRLLHPFEFFILSFITMTVYWTDTDSLRFDRANDLVPVLFGILGLISVVGRRKLTGISLKRKHEIPNLWSTYVEKIVFMIIGMFLTILARIIYEKFF